MPFSFTEEGLPPCELRRRGSSSGAARSRSRGDEMVDVRVSSFFQGNGMRGVTYFILEVAVPSGGVPSRHPATTSSAVPLHLRGVDDSRGEDVAYVSGARYVVQRRYSEGLLLRELLCFQFPTAVLPPRVPKSVAAHLMTYRCDLQTLEEQQAALQFLWTHLTCQADVVRSSPYVKAFLTEGRRECLATAANRMRQTLQRFRDANRGVDEACGVRGEWGVVLRRRHLQEGRRGGTLGNAVLSFGVVCCLGFSGCRPPPGRGPEGYGLLGGRLVAAHGAADAARGDGPCGRRTVEGPSVCRTPPRSRWRCDGDSGWRLLSCRR
eukprot:gene9014-biopygen6503